MYTSTGALGAGVTAGAGSLAFTGVNIVWLILGAFALLSAGLALLRLAPRQGESERQPTVCDA